MRISKIVLALSLGASAWAQTLPQKPQVNPPVLAKPTAARTPSSAPLHKTRALAVDTRRSPVKSVALSSRSRHGKTAPQSSIVRRQPDGKLAPIVMRGHRDPFVSPVVERMHTSATCTGSGRKCLGVGEISLHGVVRSPGGFIAVVVNGEHTYFLREKDPLADGTVERITKDAIILRERSSDALGRSVTREVTKKLGVPAV